MNKDYLAPTVSKPVEIPPPIPECDGLLSEFQMRSDPESHRQFFLDMMDMVRGMEMMDEMIRCDCGIGISRTNRLLAITNSDGSTVVEAARFSDLFIKLSRGEYVGRKD